MKSYQTIRPHIVKEGIIYTFRRNTCNLTNFETLASVNALDSLNWMTLTQRWICRGEGKVIFFLYKRAQGDWTHGVGNSLALELSVSFTQQPLNQRRIFAHFKSNGKMGDSRFLRDFLKNRKISYLSQESKPENSQSISPPRVGVWRCGGTHWHIPRPDSFYRLTLSSLLSQRQHTVPSGVRLAERLQCPCGWFREEKLCHFRELNHDSLPFQTASYTLY